VLIHPHVIRRCRKTTTQTKENEIIIYRLSTANAVDF
jgi:hypothetical protein